MRGGSAIAVMLVASACTASLSCFDSPLRKPVAAPIFPADPAREEDACARLCAALDACRASEGGCLATCESDRSRAREGLLPASVGCLEHEIASKGCGDTPEHAKAAARACWLATVTTLVQSDEERPFMSIATASCRRFMRCTRSETSSLDECVKVQRESAHGRGVHAILAATRASVVASAATCIEAEGCGVDDPLATCFSRPSVAPTSAAGGVSR